MKRTEDLFDCIDRYLANTLTSKEQSDFEKELVKNQHLRLEVEKHKALKNALIDDEILNFKKDLKEIHQEVELEEKREFRSTLFRYTGIAAVFVILIGIAAVLYLENRIYPSDTLEGLYAAYYTPFPSVSNVRIGIADSQKNIEEKYVTDAYDEVIRIYESLEDKGMTDEILLYIGNSYLAKNDVPNAVSIFKKVKRSDGYYEDALWYLALAYLKTEDISNALAILNKVIDYNGKYLEKAKMLKENIRVLEIE